MPHKYFSVDGVATYVHHIGATTLPELVPDLSRGELVLFLHGAGGNGNLFGDIMGRLAGSHSPLAFDQPGHGRSGALDSLGSIERMAGFARAICEKLSLRRPVLFGHSMGGAVALRYALDHPGDVRGLVLCASAARAEIPEDFLELLRRVTEGKERRPFTREIYAAQAPPEILKRGFMEELKTDPRVVYGDLLALRDCDLEARLGEIRTPTLVLVGEEESEDLIAQAQLLAARIPEARKVAVPGAGHMLPLEQPEAVATALGAFLNGLSA